MKFSSEFIASVQKANDIVEVIQADLSLKDTGSNFEGECPFGCGGEASFSVSPKYQIFYCFSCKASGNVFNYATQVKKMDFETAVRWLADRAHLPS